MFGRKEKQEDTEAQEKKQKKEKKPRRGPISWTKDEYVNRYFTYRFHKGFLASMTGIRSVKKFFSIANYKELLTTYKTVECEHDFDRAMEIDGVNEESLKKRHNLFQNMMIGFIVLVIPLFYMLFKVLDTRISEGASAITYISSLYPPIASLLVISLLYVFYAWLAFRIRNKWLLNQYQFLQIAIKDFNQLLPIHDIDEHYNDTKLVRNKK
tara:strand:- start:901 stop:1533 length:633 start_codon:yes stop_codon:yes gene_type:complete